MKKLYYLSLRTPQGEKTVTADEREVFLTTLLEEAVSVINSPREDNDHSQTGLDDMASLILKKYHSQYGGRSNIPSSRIARAGRELDLIKCYLRKMTINETVEWFKASKGFQTSTTAVGRYWKRLYSLKADLKS